MISELEGGALVFHELFVTFGYGCEMRDEGFGKLGTIELAPTARVVTRSCLKVTQYFSPDWRRSFAEAYRRKLQTWVNTTSRWRSCDVERALGPQDSPDAQDAYHKAIVPQSVLVSTFRGNSAAVESSFRCRRYFAERQVSWTKRSSPQASAIFHSPRVCSKLPAMKAANY